MQPALGPRSAEQRSQLAATTLGFGKDDSHALRFIPFERLSGGEKYALSFALATARVEGNVPIIVMEEPETALYPSAIARILTSVQNRGTDQGPQVIVSSHSEAVLRRFSIDNVSVMTNDRKPERLTQVVQRSRRGPAQNKTRMTVETLLMPGEASALFADKVVVVEGPCDAIVSGCLDRLAARLASESSGTFPSFASLGWAVFSAGGTGNAIDRADLFASLGKRVAIVFDADGAGWEGAEEAKTAYPTFIYQACSEEREPELEDALLLGLPTSGREAALTAFYGHAACQSCPSKASTEKCWKRDCERRPGRPHHKRDLQEACLQAYEDGRLFPAAFTVLLAKIGSCRPGAIIELPVEQKPEQDATP